MGAHADSACLPDDDVWYVPDPGVLCLHRAGTHVLPGHRKKLFLIVSRAIQRMPQAPAPAGMLLSISMHSHLAAVVEESVMSSDTLAHLLFSLSSRKHSSASAKGAIPAKTQ